MTQPRPARALDVPTVLVGLGRFGADVGRRLALERGESLRLAGQSAEADDLRLVLQDLSQEPDLFDPLATAAEVLAAVRAVLQHRRVVAARELADDAGLTRLHILVFAELGEPAVRDHLLPVLKAIERLLLSHLGPIFESYRTGAARGAAILPLLTMPHPPAHPQGAEIAATVADLLERIAAVPPEARAIPQLYLLEDVAERSILAEGELCQCLRNFASLLLYSGDLEILQQIVHGDDPNEPLATFVCAVAELPRARLAAYGAHRIALELLAAVREAPRVDTDLAALDALEQLEARNLSQLDDADKDVHAVLQRYAPAFTREPHLPWWQEGTVLLERLGPDPGDPSLLTPAAPGDPPQGWIHARMLEIQETWRLLQRRRFDDVVARDRAAVEAWRDRLLRQLRERLDESLWSAPSPAAFRQTEELAAKLSRAFGEQLERAIAERDAITPARAPSFDELRAAHAAALDAARHKPEVAALALWGALFLGTALICLPPLLRIIPLTLHLQSGALVFLCRDYPQFTAFVLALLLIGGVFGYHLSRAQLQIDRALKDLAVAAESTVYGRRGSLFDYFSSRLRLSRAIARVEVLLAIRAALDADSERLLLMDKAARRAQADLREQQRRLGVRDAEGRDDLSGLLGRPDEALIESLIGPRGAAELEGALDPSGKDARVSDLLAALAERYRGGRWREELPFADLELLTRAAARHAAPIADWDPFADARRAEATAEHLAAFLRRQWRTLRGALNFTGHEDDDRTGIRHLLRGDALLPPGGHDLIQARLGDDRTPVPARRGAEADRAYYLLLSSGIHPDAVASLRLPDATHHGASPPKLNEARAPGPAAFSGLPPPPRIVRGEDPR